MLLLDDMPIMTNTWPNLFIVGAQKGGTTTLYETLKQHPQIFMPPIKEPHYFSRDRVIVDRDLIVTKEHVYLQLFNSGADCKFRGESSPSYLWHPDVPERIQKKSPDAKIIIILRDPIERAYSQYLMDILDGVKPLAFYDFLKKRGRPEDQAYGTGKLYVELGQYFEQVKRYLNVFGQEQVLVLLFEDLKLNPIKLYSDIAFFLKIKKEPFFLIPRDGVIYNEYHSPRNVLVQKMMQFREVRLLWRRVMPGKIRLFIRKNFIEKKSPKPIIDLKSIKLLVDVFEPEIRDLEALLGCNLPELRKTWL